jgi:hypothetical protein
MISTRVIVATICVSAAGVLPAAEGNARDIVVTFDEGHFSKPTNPEGRKYSALVSVWRCNPGLEVLGTFRGSTLPSPYWVYRDVDGNPIDIDGRLHDVFVKLAAQDLESVGLHGLRPLLSLFREDNKYPIVASGSFSFKLVRHVKYSPRALLVGDGDFVPTLNQNPNQAAFGWVAILCGGCRAQRLRRSY